MGQRRLGSDGWPGRRAGQLDVVARRHLCLQRLADLLVVEDVVADPQRRAVGDARHALRLADRLADVQGFEQREFVAVRLDQFGPAQQHALARRRRLAGPARVGKGRACGGHGAVDVGGITGGDLHPGLAVRGIHAGERRAVGGVGAVAVDQQLRARTQRGGARAPVFEGWSGQHGGLRADRRHAAGTGKM